LAAALPRLGAAVTLDMLALHRGWLVDEGRDIEIQSFVMPRQLGADLDALIARAQSLLDGHDGRRTLHGPFLGFAIDAPDPDVAAVVQARMLACLSACVALGADQMVIHSPVTIWDHTAQAAEPVQALIQAERVRAVLGPVLARAADLGVTLVVENVEDIDPAARLRLVEALGSPALALSLDTGHAHYTHVRHGAPPADAFATVAGRRLAHVHLQDGDGYADRHWHPGEGSVPWRAVMAAIRAGGGAPRLFLEVRDMRGLRQGADWLIAAGLAA
jgi:sugar phosphate isomerase/epimerase